MPEMAALLKFHQTTWPGTEEFMQTLITGSMVFNFDIGFLLGASVNQGISRKITLYQVNMRQLSPEYTVIQNCTFI